jgi:hypothetical protein
MKKKDKFSSQFKKGTMPQEPVRYEDRGIGRYESAAPSVKIRKKAKSRGR